MRIGIIGGGAAGLTSAWLLDEDHDVRVFEQDARLGGHAHTVKIELDGQSHAVDAGFQFFADSAAYASFTRLLDHLDVPRTNYAATLTLYDSRDQRALAMPPLRNGRPVWPSLRPRGILDLLRFRRFLSRIPAFLARHDTTVTIAQYLDEQRLPRRFVDEFLSPLLLAFWCVEPTEFAGFAAYNVLYYLGANLPRGFAAPTQSTVAGGLEVYIDALAAGVTRGRIRIGVGAVALDRDAAGWVIQDARGTRHPFDHIIVATNAQQALRLIEPVSGFTAVTDQLVRFEYFDTTVAIHGDRRLMPDDESAWSVVNARWDGTHSHLTAWDPERGRSIFKSWVTFDEELPEPLYALVTYQHGKITPAYFAAQHALRALQGTDGLWLAGIYTADADSHESAIRSAIDVAERIAPDATRVTRMRAPNATA